MKRSLKAQLALIIGLVVAVTILLISILANFFIDRMFREYIEEQQYKKTAEYVTSLGMYYDAASGQWNIDAIHTIGMYALYDGYIIRVYNLADEMVWDAEDHDMSLCAEVMAEISERMQKKYPRLNGEFISSQYAITQNGKSAGTASISYYGPYFLSESEFQFLDALNLILIATGALSFILSVLIGWILARRISRPITRAADAAVQIAAGQYDTDFTQKTNIRELNRLMDSVEHLAQSLNKQENLRKRLTADVAHELRTPLTTVAAHLEAMIEGVWQATPARLESCHEEVLRLTEIVRDLESLAKEEAEETKRTLRELDLKAVAEIVTARLESELHRRKIDVHLEGKTVKIIGDEARLVQAVYNLLSNAIKYSPDGSSIIIQVKSDENRAELIIRDHGTGISEDDQKLIFERFYRADSSRNRKTGGAGIGLAIVRSIARAHGGDVSVESKLGQGSSFILSLPNKK